MIDALFVGICHMIGGRWRDVLGVGEKKLSWGRITTLGLRTIPPALVVYPAGLHISAIVFAFAFLGVVFRRPAMSNKFEPDGFNGWITKVGLWLVPLGKSNELRNVIMFSLRGLYDYPMAIVLTFFNPYAWAWGLLCLLQGPLEWLSTKISKGKYHWMLGELLTGINRGFYILKGAGL